MTLCKLSLSSKSALQREGGKGEEEGGREGGRGKNEHIRSKTGHDIVKTLLIFQVSPLEGGREGKRGKNVYH